MPSQIELLREAIARLEATCEPENPYLNGLKTQLVGLESQAARAQAREQFNLSVRSQYQRLPEPEDIAAAELYEQLVSQLTDTTRPMSKDASVSRKPASNEDSSSSV